MTFSVTLHELRKLSINAFASNFCTLESLNKHIYFYFLCTSILHNVSNSDFFLFMDSFSTKYFHKFQAEVMPFEEQYLIWYNIKPF